MKLHRTPEQWRTLDAKAVHCLSTEQSLKALTDARADILALAGALRALHRATGTEAPPVSLLAARLHAAKLLGDDL